MKFEKTEVWGFEHAIRGMRNPLESWDRSDSSVKFYCDQIGEWVDKQCTYDACSRFCLWEKKFFIGRNDLKLAQRLIKAGSEHRKFMRQIMVWVDITAPLYWWKEFDTYKVGTTANSTSTMHRLASAEITADCFEHPELLDKSAISNLEGLRMSYKETGRKDIWKKLIVNLPESWLQTRTVTMSYENILNIVNQRKHHKLSEWSDSFMSWAKQLPYSKELILNLEGDKKYESSL